MGFPEDIGIIDLMLNIPGADDRSWYSFMQPLFMDEASRNFVKMPAEHYFRNAPDIENQSVAWITAALEHHQQSCKANDDAG